MHPKALVDACADLVAQVLQLDHPADAVVSRHFRSHRELGPRERATLAETAYAVLRRRLRYQALAQSAPRGAGPLTRRMAILAFHGPRDFLKSALNEGERAWLDACDAMPPDAFTEAERHNLPPWLAERLQAELGADFWPLVESLDQTAPLDLRVNALRMKRDEALAALRAEGLQAEATPHSPWGIRVQGKPAVQRLALFTSGAIEVQDEGSQLLALLTGARRGEMVADFCAGAGGKTLALGAMMRNTGRLYAFDTLAHRLDALKPRLARSGLSNVHPVGIAHERDDRIKRLAGKIDRVLVDAPCSGLGTLRRNPDLKWRQTPQSVDELVQLQQSILGSAARLLKPGGRLVYATCSLLRAENEAIAEAFSTASKGEFTPLPVGPLLAEQQMDANLAQGEHLRLWPHRHGCDGFFAAVWQRRA